MDSSGKRKVIYGMYNLESLINSAKSRSKIALIDCAIHKTAGLDETADTESVLFG